MTSIQMSFNPIKENSDYGNSNPPVLGNHILIMNQGSAEKNPSNKRIGTGQQIIENQPSKLVQQRSSNIAVDVYKQALPRPKGISNYASSSGATNQLLNKIKQKKYQDSTKLKLAGAASLQRENCNSDLGIHINASIPISQQSAQMNQFQKNLNNSPNQRFMNLPSNKQTIGSSSRNPNQNQSQNHQNQYQNFGNQQKLIKDFSRNQIDKRQSISFDKQTQKQPNEFAQFMQKNPYYHYQSKQGKQKQSNQKLKDKSYSILTNNNIGNLKQKLGHEPNSNKNSSQKPTPRGLNKINFNSDLNNGLQSANGQKLPVLPPQQEKSLERNNSVISRKELIKKEYNKIIENKLPNILQLMNVKNQMNEISVSDQNFEYDDTDILQKMFQKDNNRSGILSQQELQQSLQQNNERYMLKQNLTNKHQPPLHSSHSQERFNGSSSRQRSDSQHRSSLEQRKESNGPGTHKSNSKAKHHVGQTSLTDASFLKDDELIKLDRLQLINASARFELLSANQQLLDFHLNRVIKKKFKNRKVLGQEKISNLTDDINQLVVCEDLYNENEEAGASSRQDQLYQKQYLQKGQQQFV